jgi:hypothetical protein
VAQASRLCKNVFIKLGKIHHNCPITKGISMSIESADAVQNLIEYLKPAQRRYFTTQANLLGYYEDGKYLFGYFGQGGANKESYDITISINYNYITIDIPDFRGFGYYFSFSTSYQKMTFDDDLKILIINGEKGKNGKPYTIKLGFNLGPYNDLNLYTLQKIR